MLVPARGCTKHCLRFARHVHDECSNPAVCFLRPRNLSVPSCRPRQREDKRSTFSREGAGSGEAQHTSSMGNFCWMRKPVTTGKTKGARLDPRSCTSWRWRCTRRSVVRREGRGALPCWVRACMMAMALPPVPCWRQGRGRDTTARATLAGVWVGWLLGLGDCSCAQAGGWAS